MRYLLVAMFMGLAGTAIAQDQQYLSSDGALFAYEKNRYGAVLTSVDPATEGLTEDSASPALAPGEILYLGRYCDALNKRLGEGRWVATEGGFLVDFADLDVVFPGQDIEVGSGGRCRE